MNGLVQCHNCHRCFRPGVHIKNHIQTCVAPPPHSAANPSSVSEAKASNASAAKASAAKASKASAAKASPPSVVEQFWEEFRRQKPSSAKTSSLPRIHGVGNPSSAKTTELPIIEALNTLGLKTLGNLSDVRKAYLSSALNKHPDKNGNTPEATKAFQDLNSAYEYLIDKLTSKGGSKRRKYRKTRRHTKRHRRTHG